MLEKIKTSTRKDLLLIVLGLFFSTLLWAFFLNSSTLAWRDFLDFSFSNLKNKLFNTNFFAFLVMFSLSLGIACFASLKLRTRTAILNVLIGSLPGVLASYLVFPIVSTYWFLLLFYPFSLSALVFTTSIKLSEIKKFTLFRSFWAGIGAFTLLLAIGFFLFGVITIMPSQQKYLEKIESAVAGGVMGSDLQEKLVKENLRSQYRLLYNIFSSDEYQAMSNVNDERVQAFNEYYLKIVDSVNKALDNPKKYLEKNIALGQKSLDAHSLLEQSVPGYTLFSKYFYIIYPFLLFTIIISFGNIVFRLFGAFIGLVLSSALKNI